MKKIFTLISAFAISIGVKAQAPVPTSYDFENGGTYPTGWTLNPLGTGTQYYTTSFACNSSAYSLKLDLSGENLVIFLASQPGEITYNIRGNTGTSSPWNGNFQIQESVDGNSWTAIKTYTGTGGASGGGLDVSMCVSQNRNADKSSNKIHSFYLRNKNYGKCGSGRYYDQSS